MTRMASGDAPDLFLHYPHNADFRAFCENGYVQDLTNEDFINNIKDDIKDMLINLQGKVYVVPISTNAYGVLYNEKEFQSLGLEIPKTYNEFVDMLKVIKEAGKTAIVFGDKSAGLIDQFARSMYPSYIQDYESFFNKIANKEISATTSPELRKIAEIMLELRTYAQEDNLGTGYDQAIADFANEKATMFICGIWAIPAIQKANPDLQFAMFPFPGENKEDTKAVYGTDAAVAMSSTSKNIDACKEFLAFLASTEAAQIFADKDKSPSCIKGVNVSVKEYEAVNNLLNTSGKSALWPDAYWGPGVKSNHKVILQKLIASKDIDQFLTDIDEIFEGSLD